MLSGRQIIDQSTPAYPYKAFFEKFFTYSLDEKKGSLQDLELYFEDSPSTTSKVSLTEDQNLFPELKAKNDLIKSKTVNDVQVGTKVYFSIFLHIDFFLTDKYLPHDIDITIRLIRCDH